MRMRAGFAALGAVIMLAGCQSATGGGAGASVSGETFDASGNAPRQVATAASAGPAASAPEPSPAAFAATTTAPAICASPLAEAPPPAPAKGADFAKNAVGNNLKRNLARNAITQLGGAVGGGIGAAVAGGLAADRIRSEQDLDGNWALTDGKPDCGCAIEISAGVNLQGDTAAAGAIKKNNCVTLAGATRWSLTGRSFTGYDTKLQLLAKDRKTVLATMNRNGLNHFSGTLPDGTAVTMWRRGG